ncbi:FIST signal transduction protein [Alteromonas sp. IB21]|uniref:FIST signal transduction protein n=1 Tax=Alteromonas sp. IB21 TaxID=2779369 RepID=UPI001E429C19|nr:FIST N-terminal domain-containing protein [Alteromonas sp. IB21]
MRAFAPSFVIAFASPTFFLVPSFHQTLTEICVNCVGCSTAGEISGNRVFENGISLVAIRFSGSAQVKIHHTHLQDMQSSFNTGQSLADGIDNEGLRGVYLLAPGVDVNGSALLAGLATKLPEKVGISGGLAGDYGAFEQTYVLHPEGVDSRSVSAIAFYGESLSFDYSANGGWRSFGPARAVTSAIANQLFELDGRPALDIYRDYLGDYANDLPASGLLFPFEVLNEEGQPTQVIRTILGIDESSKSLILAGEVQTSHYLRLMHASTDDLIDGAHRAINGITHSNMNYHTDYLALVTSCVGRKLVMGDRVEEEIEEIDCQLTGPVCIAGFYSYGEISPLLNKGQCELHNQTLTIMLLREAC